MTQTKIPINKPSITSLERKYVADAIANGWGERCYDYIYRFEAEFAKYMNANHALATSSCTGAIHLALMALGVKAGDEVIVPETSKKTHGALTLLRSGKLLHLRRKQSFRFMFMVICATWMP
jgi:dTDP-4-amino-4,6-dideoxygalactose transaminase